jgi:diguanylate cyclase (GGDEF)-like protein/PAS domain S-box-containing protein
MHPALTRPVRRLFGDEAPPEATRQLIKVAGTIIADIERQRDVTTHMLEELARELEDRLERARASESRYHMLFDAGPHPTFVLRRSDRAVLDWNSAAERVLAWPREDVLQRAVETLGLCEAGCQFAMRLMGTGPMSAADVVETRLHARDGRLVDVEVQGLDMQLGGEPAVLVMLRDVTAQRVAERAQQESAARVRAFFDHAGIAIQLLALDGTILEANSACRDMFGHHAETLLGTRVLDLACPDAVPLVQEAITELVTAARDVVTFEACFRHAEGTTVWGQVTIATVALGGERRLMAMLQNATDRKRMEQQLVQQAFEDELTGLANRALFRDRLAHALDRRLRHRTDVAVLLLDLDGFKRVNDSLGHAAGDALLRAIARRIALTVRAGETVARLGGDEFAIVIESVQQDEDPMALADRLLREIATPVEIAGREVVVNVSIGIAIAQPGEDGDAVLRNADTAMYSAKSAGKQCARLFDPAMHARALVWLEIEQDLRRALGQDEFELHFQPLLRLGSGALRGFEALLRWRHPRRGLMAPSEFLGVAEETGLVVPIGRWVLHEACRHAAAWGADVEPAPTISVNVAPRQLEDDGFINDVRDALRASGLEPRRLVLEITESQIMRTPELAKERLHALRALGVRIAIDDFGTGYSSLSHLQFFPVDELKIDRSFVARVDDGDRGASFVRTMVSLAQSLGVEVVAEGIEHDAQERFLTTLGCDTGQGYLFSRPMTGDDAEVYARERSGLTPVHPITAIRDARVEEVPSPEPHGLDTRLSA